MREVSFEPDRIAGVVAVHPVDASARSIVLLFDERHVDQVRERVERLRRLIRLRRTPDESPSPSAGAFRAPRSPLPGRHVPEGRLEET
jgi:hypothetical protein